MKSFIESLQITKNMNLAKQCFRLMAEKGLDPERFVDWYCDFGIHYQEKGVLTEGSIKWLETELLSEGWWDTTKAAVGNFLSPQNIANKAGQATAQVGQFANQVGQTATNMQDKFHQGMGQPAWWRQAASAEQALNQLHRRIGVSPQLSQAVGGQAFMQTILQLMQVLKSKDQSQMAAPAAAPTPMPPEDSTGDAWRGHTESLRLKNDIRAGLRTLQSLGHDPVAFVEWFGEEIKKLNEGLWDSAGEFLGNTWANTMGTANRWLTGGEKQNWGYDAKQRVSKKDSEAITQAMQTLDGLQKSIGNLNPEFKQTLDGVLQVLQSDKVKQYMSGQTAPEEAAPEAPAAPETAPEATPTPAPAPEAAPVDNGMGGNTAALNKTPVWAGQLPQGASPDDPASVQAAMNIFNNLPDDQKQEIDQNARRVWVKKGRPAQDQAGMDQDKARAMYAMSKGLDMSNLPTEWFRQDDLRFIESICGTGSWFS